MGITHCMAHNAESLCGRANSAYGPLHISRSLGRYLRCFVCLVSFCYVCWQACTVRKPPTTAIGSTNEGPFMKECRRTPLQIATATWACAQVGRQCAAQIKVSVRRSANLLIKLSRFAATIRQTIITAEGADKNAQTGTVCLASVSIPVRFLG